ncbi:cobalamin-binding domain protein [Halobacillus fulvus]|nr:cobalamin-binding domain protein [Halobacillus fulvus]
MNQHHEELARVFLNGDEDEALDMSRQLLRKYSKAHFYESIVTPAMYYIGELWQQNKISVADEHLATAICDFVLSKLESDSEPKPAKKQKKNKAILFGVEEEQHYIGLKMVAETFKDHGWRVRYLGPNLPLEHSLIQIEKYKPEVIGVSAALTYRLPTIRKLIDHFMELEWKPLVLVGGRMARKFDLKEFEADRVMVIKGISDLNQWFNEGRVGVINETS